MDRMRVLLVAAVAAAVLIVLFVVLRPGDSDDSTPTANGLTDSGGPGNTATTRPSDSTSTAAAPAATPVTRVRITFRDGRVVGGIRRVTLVKGERAELIVRADVSDEIHLHGYDLSRDVTPGTRARLRFKATLVGRFEVELEQRGLQIAEVEVEP